MHTEPTSGRKQPDFPTSAAPVAPSSPNGGERLYIVASATAALLLLTSLL